jgi:hypothetical protein
MVMIREDELLMGHNQERRTEELQEISLLIGSILDRTVKEIFLVHQRELLSEPINCIIHAVWGAKAEGEFSLGQHKMNKRVLFALDQIREIFTTTNLDPNQKFAFDYLVRGFISTRIMFMKAAFENELYKDFSAHECMDGHSRVLM